ncbi:MAG TPA: flagellar biosynthetic protein FliO [Actinotalea sp.]|nr:flagellar biosynthetic protein FliO [Actinotalea sp.]
MDSSGLLLGLRVLLSLAVVLGLLWWLARRTAGTRVRARQATVSVVGRHSLSRHAGVAVVEVEGRRLLLGVTDHGISLLSELTTASAAVTDRTEIDPDELARMVGLDEDEVAHAGVVVSPTDVPTGLSGLAPTPLSRRPAARTPAVPMPRHPLEGSILDAKTWRQAVVAVQERTIRR